MIIREPVPHPSGANAGARSALTWSAGPSVVAETLDGGQCFRWNCGPDGIWRGVSGTCVAEVRETVTGVDARVTAGSAQDLRWHLADEIDWPALADQLPWRTDTHLARCIAAFPGLRILRQPVGEALLCFLCSATKQIAQIKQMAELLAENFGRELIAPDPAPAAPPAAPFHPLVDSLPLPAAPRHCQPMADNAAGASAAGATVAGTGSAAAVVPAWTRGRLSARALPTWTELGDVSEAQLRACKLGFRARHVHAVARRLAEQPGWLQETAALPYVEAKTRLISLPGVGEKIADCVLLFGAGKLEAFPVDVWILRALARRYRLDGWRPAQVAQFGRAHFGPLAGLAQQFLFAWERRHGREGAPRIDSAAFPPSMGT